MTIMSRVLLLLGLLDHQVAAPADRALPRSRRRQPVRGRRRCGKRRCSPISVPATVAVASSAPPRTPSIRSASASMPSVPTRPTRAPPGACTDSALPPARHCPWSRWTSRAGSSAPPSNRIRRGCLPCAPTRAATSTWWKLIRHRAYLACSTPVSPIAARRLPTRWPTARASSTCPRRSALPVPRRCSFSRVDGSALTSVALARLLAVLNADPNDGLLTPAADRSGPSITASLDLVRVNPATGASRRSEPAGRLLRGGGQRRRDKPRPPDRGGAGDRRERLLVAHFQPGQWRGELQQCAGRRQPHRQWPVRCGKGTGADNDRRSLPSSVRLRRSAENYSVNVSVTATSGAVSGSVTVDDGIGGRACSRCRLRAHAGRHRGRSAHHHRQLDGPGSLPRQQRYRRADAVRATSVTSITSTAPPGSAVVGQPYTVNVSVSGFGPPTGSMAVDDGAGATCNIVLPAGSCVLTSTTVWSEDDQRRVSATSTTPREARRRCT